MDRRSVLRGMAAGALAAGAAGGSREAAANDVDKPNILFISIDDLNDWVGILGGHAQADTPHLDALAARAVSFENAHCAAPVCNPSRVSVMTGLRPSTSGVYENDQPLRKALPTVKTLLSRLVAKGAVATEPEGRKFLYSPLLERADYVGGESRRLVDRLFGGRAAPLFAHLAENEALTDQDLAEIETLLKELRK